MLPPEDRRISSPSPATVGATVGASLGSSAPLLDRGAERLAKQATPASVLKSEPTTAERLAGTKPATTIEGLPPVPSYKGDLPSPLQVMWYAPENSEVLKVHFPDSEIRGWVQDAAAYNDVPHEMLATVLQQENAPSASNTQKVLQFGERSVTTFGAIADKYTFGLVPDKLAGGSSGIANMKRETLRNGADYIEDTYGRSPLPDDVRYRALGWDQDTRIPGDDLKADLYYASGVLRQLIDQEKGAGYQGPLTLDETQRIIASYNGSGPLAEKYGQDAIHTLTNAANGQGNLYFFERRTND